MDGKMLAEARGVEGGEGETRESDPVDEMIRKRNAQKRRCDGRLKSKGW